MIISHEVCSIKKHGGSENVVAAAAWSWENFEIVCILIYSVFSFLVHSIEFMTIHLNS